MAQHGVQGPMKVTKLNSKGEVLWTKSFPGDSTECGSLAMDGQNNILLTGYISGSATFDGTTLQTAGPRNWDRDLFVLKLNPNGKVLWVRRAGLRPEWLPVGRAIGADAAGNVFVGGGFKPKCDFERILLASRSSGNFDSFLAKWSTTGDLLWVARVGEPAISNGGTERLDAQTEGAPVSPKISSLVIDSQGRCRMHCNDRLWVYPSGGGTAQDFSVGVAAGDGSVSAINGGTALDAEGNCYVTGMGGVISKVNPSGAVLWTRTVGGSYSQDVGVDRAGNAIIAGAFVGTLQVGATTLTSAGNDDIFVVAFSPAGDLLWATSAGGAGHDFPRGIVVNHDGRIWIAGYYGSLDNNSVPATFGEITLPAPTDGQKVYVAALDPRRA